MGDRTRHPPKTAVVLSGAAARGAFQAGALAELLPSLERDGATPTILLGTSAGSINATLWGSWAHLGAERAAENLVALWAQMSHANVFEPLLASLVHTGLQFESGLLLGRGRGTSSLLDTRPLQRTAERELDVERLASNIASGRPSAVGVVATRVPSAAADTIHGSASGRSVLFLHEQMPSGYAGDPDRAQDVIRCHLSAEHVLASVAIPIAFPARQISEPPAAAGWYVDGGIRLNTPLRPAIRLGATRVIVISATSTVYGSGLPPDTTVDRPDVADSGAQLLHAVLADRMIEDLLAVRRTNRLLDQFAHVTSAAMDTGLRRADDGQYHRVELMTVSPPPGDMGRLATAVFARKASGLRGLQERDLNVIGRLLRGAGDATGRRELLSYLLFDEDYFRESIELGRAAARTALATGWQS